MAGLDSEKKQLFQTLCTEQVLSNISPEEVRAQKRLRKNEQDLLVLRGKLEKCHDSDIVLSNREIRLLKYEPVLIQSLQVCIYFS